MEQTKKDQNSNPTYVKLNGWDITNLIKLIHDCDVLPELNESEKRTYDKLLKIQRLQLAKDLQNKQNGGTTNV